MKPLRPYSCKLKLKQQVELFIKMRKARFNLKECARELNISQHSVYKLKKFVEQNVRLDEEVEIPDSLSVTPLQAEYKKSLSFDERIEVLTNIALGADYKALEKIRAIVAMTDLLGDARREVNLDGSPLTVLKLVNPKSTSEAKSGVLNTSANTSANTSDSQLSLELSGKKLSKTDDSGQFVIDLNIEDDLDKEDEDLEEEFDE